MGVERGVLGGGGGGGCAYEDSSNTDLQPHLFRNSGETRSGSQEFNLAKVLLKRPREKA